MRTVLQAAARWACVHPAAARASLPANGVRRSSVAGTLAHLRAVAHLRSTMSARGWDRKRACGASHGRRPLAGGAGDAVGGLDRHLADGGDAPPVWLSVWVSVMPTLRIVLGRLAGAALVVGSDVSARLRAPKSAAAASARGDAEVASTRPVPDGGATAAPLTHVRLASPSGARHAGGGRQQRVSRARHRRPGCKHVRSAARPEAASSGDGIAAAAFR